MQYFGGQSYDFSAAGLVALAGRLIAQNKLEQAVEWLRLNLEFYPQSASSYLALSQAEARRSNKAEALNAARKALELDPQNVAIRRQVDNLSKP